MKIDNVACDHCGKHLIGSNKPLNYWSLEYRINQQIPNTLFARSLYLDFCNMECLKMWIDNNDVHEYIKRSDNNS